MSFLARLPVLADEETKSLVLHSDDPFELRGLIPKSRTLDHPEWNFACLWDNQSAQFLRNIGFDAPMRPLSNRWPGKYQPLPHQLEMINFIIDHKRGFNLSEMGCVSADTEYLSPEGWRRIDQYTGGKVAQYWPKSREIEFVEPNGYIKRPCETMIRFQTTRGIDQLLSPEHRVLLADGSETTARAILENYGNQNVESRRTRFRTTFKIRDGQPLPLTDEEIRVQIAVNADGYVDKHRVYVRLKKTRKIDRLRQLLVDAEIEFNEGPCLPEGFIKFGFYPPMSKGFDERWWQASQHQLEIVADELAHWDGSVRKSQGNQFFSSLSDQADFAQFAFSASGRRASKNLSVTQWGDVHVVHASIGDGTVGLYGRTGHRPSNNVRYEPSPDGFKYCFEVPSTFLLLRRNGCIVATGNTMKTAAALWAADVLMKRGELKKVLILSPLSTVERVWQQDIFDVLMHRICAIVHGTREQREFALNSPADFYILNHDGVSIPWLNKVLRKRKDIGMIIVDEGGMFRNDNTNKFSNLEMLIQDHQRVLWMTGTPCPNAPTDAWAQAKIINPTAIPKFPGTWKRQTMYQVTPFKWVPRAGSEKMVYSVLQPAIRFLKKDVQADLPPCVTIDLTCGLTADQLRAYTEMFDEMVAEAAGIEISAVNAADKINKLRQILTGVVKDTKTGEYLSLGIGPRVKAIRDAIEMSNSKAIVIFPFKGILREMAKALAAHVPGRKQLTIGVLNGDVPIAQRNKIIHAFKTTDSPTTLLCHPAVMAHGLNLTEADMTIMGAPIYSNDQFEQVVERMNRMGQKHSMTVARIGAHPLEWSVYRMVEGRRLTQKSILDLYRQLVGKPVLTQSAI